MTRDPKQDPKRADMLKSAEGVLLTVLGRPEFDDIIGVDPCVRYSQSEVPYISTVNLPRWQNMVRDHEVEHVAT